MCPCMYIRGAVLSRQNTSSEQPKPNMAATNFVAATSMGEGFALNETAIAAVLINQ